MSRATSLARIAIFGSAVLSFGLASGAALAQRPPPGDGGGGTGGTRAPAGPAINPDDHFEFVDQNGVDLSNGQRLETTTIDGGAAGTITFRRNSMNWEFWLHYYPTGERGTPEKWEINDGLRKHIFRSVNSSQAFYSSAVDGSTFQQLGNGDYLFTDRDGNTIRFPEVRRVQGQQDRRYAQYKQFADGKRYTVRSTEDLTCLQPIPGQTPNPSAYTGCYVWDRRIKLQGVETSDGYFFKANYESYSPAAGITLERRRLHILGNQNARYCNVVASSCTLDQEGYSWADKIYNGNSIAGPRTRDRLGRDKYFSATVQNGRTLSALVDFGYSTAQPRYTVDNTALSDNVSVSTVPGECRLVGGFRKIGVRRFITIDGTSNYNVREGDCEPLVRIAEATYPDGSSAYALTDLGFGGSGRPKIVSRRPTAGASATDDGVNRITRYEFSTRLDLAPIANVGAKDNTGARLMKVTFPEGNYIEYDYDDRRNVTQQRVYPKPGSSDPVLTTSMTYPASCSNPKTCNKPTSVVDARGNTTNYTYSAQHGGVLSVTGPADANGVRPQTRYEYAQRYAWYRRSNGTFAQGPTAHWLLTKEEFCRTTAAVGSGCAGGAADEVVTTYDYGPNNGPNNLLLRGKVVTASGQSLRTCYLYDEMGRKIAETQPNGTGSTCP
ncbi:MAG: hypothetical protein QNJ15_07340 [Erythrobacter sp.]|nr:hypothetical protein [Erythrobacter sp.]